MVLIKGDGLMCHKYILCTRNNTRYVQLITVIVFPLNIMLAQLFVNLDYIN